MSTANRASDSYGAADITVLEGLEALWEIGPAESTGAPMVQGYALAAPRIVSTDFSNWIAQFRPQPEAPAVRMVKTFR